MALQELKMLAHDMTRIFAKDPHFTDWTTCLPGLDDTFILFKRCAQVFRDTSLDVGPGKGLCYAFAALQADYDQDGISWTTQRDDSQQAQEDFEVFEKFGQYEFAHVLRMKRLLKQAHASDDELQRFISCRDRFLANLDSVLNQDDINSHVPRLLQGSQAFIPSKLLRYPAIADHVRKVGLRDCLGRSVSHMLYDAKGDVVFSQSEVNNADVLGRTSLYFACQSGKF